MICKKCGKDFFEDWRKDRETRKTPCMFCSRSCSNSRNHTDEMNEKISSSLYKKHGTEPQFCSKCGSKLNRRNKSGLCINCKSPSKTRYEYIKNFRKKRKEFLVNYKGGKCEVCGYNKCIGAFDFHHLDPSRKDFNLGSTKGKEKRALEDDIKEVNKCILVCATCHREIHYSTNNPKVS